MRASRNSDATVALSAGTRLGPYEIVSPLGAGGMGEVYKARDGRLDRTVAIKVLPVALAGDAEFRDRFDREARAVSQLDHPHICALYDIGQDHDTAYLVMQYHEGETLEHRLKSGALPLDQALKTAIEIAGALDAAHRAGIIHRDLKPANIILTKAGAKLLDFGLAKTLPAVASGSVSMMHTTPAAGMTAPGTILGTFQYMSPEQIEGEELDARSDIFAFGAVVYEMVTGRKAFAGKTQASLIGAILKDEPPPASQVQAMTPPALDYLVRTCFAKDPDARFQTAHDVWLQLRWIAEGGSAVGLPAPLVSRRRSRERLAWAAAAVLGVIAAGAGALGVVHLRERPAVAEPVQFTIAAEENSAFVTPADANDLWVLPVFGDRKPTPFLQTRFIEDSPAFSPDDRWVAYNSNASGRFEVYIRSFRGPGGQFQVSRNGGWAPRWRRDGKEIFFLGLDGAMMAADVTLGKEIQASVPRALFPTPLVRRADRHTYAVTGDGKRFLLRVPDQRQVLTPITMVLNWPGVARK